MASKEDKLEIQPVVLSIERADPMRRIAVRWYLLRSA
jgi:hypothetical protein